MVQWGEPTTEEWDRGLRIIVNHFKEIKQVSNQSKFLINKVI